MFLPQFCNKPRLLYIALKKVVQLLQQTDVYVFHFLDYIYLGTILLL